MKRAAGLLMRCSLATIVGLAALACGNVQPDWQAPFVATADAQSSRSLTSMSDAGVARRTMRGVAAVDAATAAGASVRECRQDVDCYGARVRICW